MNWTRALSAAGSVLVVAAWLSCTSNHPPDAPAVPSGPDYCFRDTTYTFTTVASDPDGDSIAFRLDWGDSTFSHWEGWFAGGETVAFSHTWSDTGTYEVHAWAQDQKLLSSEPSDSLTVRVVVRWPPDTPTTPAGPNVGVMDSSYTFVAGAEHPDRIPVAIRFAWGDGDTSEWSEFVLSGAPVRASHRWSGLGTFAVTAQAKDTGELTSPWSLPHDINVGRSGYLMMVGQPILAPDSKGFLINAVNGGTVEVAVNSLAFSDTSAPLYMRDFRIGLDRCGYPLLPGMRGTGPGDTVRFTAPVTVQPSDLVELFFAEFRVDPLGVDTAVDVRGETFRFRFDDGSEITVAP